LNVVDDLIARGHDLRNYCRDLLSFFRDLLIAKIAGDSEHLLETAILNADELNKYSLHFTESDLIRFFNSLSETESKLREATQSRYVLEIGLVKLIEMRRVAPLEKILERLTKLEAALSNGNFPTDGIVSAGTPLEKKTLKVDFPSEEVPFPVSDAKIQFSSQNFSSEPAGSGNGYAVAVAETAVIAPAASQIQESKPAPVTQISDYKLKINEPPEFSEAEPQFPSDIEAFKSYREPRKFEHHQQKRAEISNFNSEIDEQSHSSADSPLSNGNSQIRTLAEKIAAMPSKMPPISSEELEHFDDDKLDAAYENRLLRAGDNLFPLKNAVEVAETLIGNAVRTNELAEIPDSLHGADGTRPKAKPVFEMPVFDADDDTDEVPVLPENPTSEEMLAYAQKHPAVKKVLRAFRGKIVEVKKL
jgi:DNA polymerase III gamma/tau subunit